MSVPEPADDIHDLLQGNWPKDDEDKFIAAADAYVHEAGVHANDAALHRTTINTLHEGVWAGLLADEARAGFKWYAEAHDAGEVAHKKIADILRQSSDMIRGGKNEIVNLVEGANSDIRALEMAAQTGVLPRDVVQTQIEAAIAKARAEIAEHATRLEANLVKQDTAMKTIMDALIAKYPVPGACTSNAGANTSDSEFRQTKRISTDSEERALPSLPSPDSSEGQGPAPKNDGGGAQAEAAAPPPASVVPQQPPGAGQPFPQAQQMPQPGPGAGGVPSQLPGQELASKAMDMAQQHDNSGGGNTFLSDAAVKDLLSNAEHDGPGSHDSSTAGEDGQESRASAAPPPHASSPAPAESGFNPVAASGPSPATPVVSHPVAGPLVAVGELAGDETLGAATSGITVAAQTPQSAPYSFAHGEASAAAAQTPQSAPYSFAPPTHTAGPVVGGAARPNPGLVPLSPPTVLSGQAPNVPPEKALEQSSPGSGAAAPVPLPYVVPGVPPPPASMRFSPHLADKFFPSKLKRVVRHVPDGFDSMPVEARMVVQHCAQAVTHMYESDWFPSMAMAFVDDGHSTAFLVATADDLAILPPDTPMPTRVFFLHALHLGEAFRAEWAGNADVVAKLLAALELHPGLNASMAKHVCAYTRLDEVKDPALASFTPLSLDAAYAIKHFYQRQLPATMPVASSFLKEDYTRQQLDYLLDAAEDMWALDTRGLQRTEAVRLESATVFASRWARGGEARFPDKAVDYDRRIGGYLWAAARDALQAGDERRASWYAHYLQYQTLPVLASRGPRSSLYAGVA